MVACRADGHPASWGVAVQTPATCPARSVLRSHPSALQVALPCKPILEPRPPPAPLQPEHSAGLRVGRARVMVNPQWSHACQAPLEPASPVAGHLQQKRGLQPGVSLSETPQPIFPPLRGSQPKSSRHTELHGHAEPRARPARVARWRKPKHHRHHLIPPPPPPQAPSCPHPRQASQLPNPRKGLTGS